MMQRVVAVWVVMSALALSFPLTVQADPVSYAAHLETSKLNPVTHVLILEAEADGTVHAVRYAEELPGSGYAVVLHEPAYKPVRSLLIGLTEGEDEDGNDKTQIVMFLDDHFAAANQEAPFSDAFPGARHSDTITRLLAAHGGDAAQLDWFTGTFFSGPAAAAVFSTGGSFTVAEFTVLNTIGSITGLGDWFFNAAGAVLPPGSPGSLQNLLTVQLYETAVGPGPFDLIFQVDGAGTFAVDKYVLNDADFVMSGFSLELGTGQGASFEPWTEGDPHIFNLDDFTAETNNIFQKEGPASGGLISFAGTMNPGETANFRFFITTSTEGPHSVTVRQRAFGGPSRATFWVLKRYADENSAPVEVTLSCNTGLPLEQTTDVDPLPDLGVVFVVTDFDEGELDCTVSESPPSGYAASYVPGGPANAGADQSGCHYTGVGAGSENFCEITNVPEPVAVVIDKEWVFEGGVSGVETYYELTLHCDSEIVGGEAGCGVPVATVFGPQPPADWCVYFSGNGAEQFVAEVVPRLPYTTCFVEEQVFDDAIEVGNGCGSLQVSVGQGASCTITNTVFFEGIPTLSEYGKLLMALLLLGVGVLAYRRWG